MIADAVRVGGSNLLGCTRDQLDTLRDAGARDGTRGRIRTDRTFADKVFKTIHRNGETEVSRNTAINKDVRDYFSNLEHAGTLQLPEVADEAVSADGTRKWLLKFADGESVETVFIPTFTPGGHRGTLCVSSQVGCPLNCAFCATARGGFKRNLTTAEIIAQLWLAKHRLLEAPARVSNIVFMGMGEPLLNIDAVTDALHIMIDDHAYGLGERHITVSTAGHIKGMRILGERVPVNLSVSLHAPDDELRDRLVPLNRKYPIADVLEACRDYARQVNGANGFVTFEYSLLRNVNDSEAQARALTGLLRDVPCKINLLPFNDFPGSTFEPPTADAVARFQHILADCGYVTTVRHPRGSDIAAACGQLRRHSESAQQPPYMIK